MKYIDCDRVLTDIKEVLSGIDGADTEKLLGLMTGSERIFMAGSGRTGLIIRAFAIRCMQMGFETYVIGETTTPAIKKGDTLLIGSGSGETETLKVIARKAKDMKAGVALITAAVKSSLAGLSDTVFLVPARGSKTEVLEGTQPMANLFEQALLIYLDMISVELIERNSIDITTLYDRHANLE